MVRLPRLQHKELALMSVTGVLTGVESGHFFSAKLPSTMTIQSFVTTPEAEAAIYDGLWKANVGSAVMASIITVASKAAGIRYWWLPAVATVGVCAFMTWSYLDDLKAAPINQQTATAKFAGGNGVANFN